MKIVEQSPCDFTPPPFLNPPHKFDFGNGGVQLLVFNFHTPLLCLRSTAVFALWHAEHSNCLLLSSSAPPSESGVMWSTSVPGITIPRHRQCWHSPLSRRWIRARSATPLRPVLRLPSDPCLPYPRIGLCSIHQAPCLASRLHPGCLQALGAAIGIPFLPVGIDNRQSRQCRRMLKK